jgi:hydroxymethylpyrimidine pyrophosphatase-like HAD family hydrolase
MDLTSRDVNKGTALEILAKHLKIQSQDITAIGDQPIDLPMLAFAGLPIAMKNAPDSLKKLQFRLPLPMTEMVSHGH